MPDFDFEEFYVLAKRINDFINDPEFEVWAELITASAKCKTQVKFTWYTCCVLTKISD